MATLKDFYILYLAVPFNDIHAANLEQNMYKFAKTNAPPPPEYQGPTWLECRI